MTLPVSNRGSKGPTVMAVVGLKLRRNSLTTRYASLQSNSRRCSYQHWITALLHADILLFTKRAATRRCLFITPGGISGYIDIMSRSSSFCLPRELRDEVHKYALHHAAVLLYRVTKSGIGRLSKYDKRSAYKRPFRWLRSRSSGMAIKKWSAGGPEHNQLRHVHRWLRNETRSASMRFNLICVQHSATMKAVEQCIPFFQHCIWPQQLCVICEASLFSWEIGEEKLVAFVRHCALHADVLVRMHVPYWSQADPNFVHCGLSYLWRLRGDVYLMK
jgi:hypothetical protein